MRVLDKIETRIKEANSLLCVGIDPDLEKIGKRDRLEFLINLVTETKDYVAAYKLNLGFYLSFENGPKYLRELTSYIPYNIPVILDGKFGDIGNTSKQYAAFAKDIYCDAVTLNPYMGDEAVKPFIEEGLFGFVLCRTTSKSVYLDLQESDIRIGYDEYQPTWEFIAEGVGCIADHTKLGLVVGAADIGAMVSLRKQCPEKWFLVPGIGAQGGDLEDVLKAGLNSKKEGLLINVGRDIVYSDNPKEKARDYRDRINVFRC